MESIENSILGHLVANPYDFRLLPENFPYEVFTDETTKELFLSLTALRNKNMNIDKTSVCEWASIYGNKNKKTEFYLNHLEKIEVRLLSGAIFSNSIKILMSKYVKFQMSDMAMEIVSGKKFENGDVESVLESNIRQNLKLKKLFQPGNGLAENDPKLYFKVMKQISLGEKAQQLSGIISSGFKGIDICSGGWRPGELIVIGGRPAMGKTAFLLSSISSILKKSTLPIGFFSVEDTPEQIMMRLMSNLSGVPAIKMEMGSVNQDQTIQIHEATEFLADAPLFINHLSDCSIEEILENASKLIKEKGIKLLMIDYLQLLKVDTKIFKSRDAEIAFITRSLKIFAKENNIPIVITSALSRDVERRALSKIPTLSDLRDSGAIEQDATQVYMIYRPAYYGFKEDEDGNTLNNIAKIVVAKNNHGYCEEIKMHFTGQYYRFKDWEMDGLSYLNLRNDDLDDKFPF
ncbi:MAG: replicative DNA helicase [Bacteroidota bacterium]|jgi:replicative DNA helicase